VGSESQKERRISNEIGERLRKRKNGGRGKRLGEMPGCERIQVNLPAGAPERRKSGRVKNAEKK